MNMKVVKIENKIDGIDHVVLNGEKFIIGQTVVFSVRKNKRLNNLSQQQFADKLIDKK